MIIDLRKIAASGKDDCDFYFEYVPETELSDVPNVEIVPPIKINGKATLTDKHSAYIECDIVFKLRGECTRCLAQTEKEYSITVAESIEPNNEDGYSVVNDKFDFRNLVDDAVIMNMPVAFLCKEDCKGVCAGCGADLNVDECKCEKQKEGKE